MAEKTSFVPQPGTCVPWSFKREELGGLAGDEEIVRQEWEKLDVLAYAFIWFWVQR
ncbi:Uncharacterized [Moorella glycerini]|uniref:Uncharacterized protein n=1 Tax=Neomoorella stamsii TaxID=1266720 RepID=A0A9X7P4I9_9FIRM|nr:MULTISPECIES: hypothetical protein [Moorella]PRR68561.1 hypothetical protein MOST_33400 [Moorella stamsii]CEP66115.1 Uncharacterized [Moorella glycerini]